MTDFSVVTVSDPYTYAFTYARATTFSTLGVETVNAAGTTFTSASIPATTQSVKAATTMTGDLLKLWDRLFLDAMNSSFLEVAPLGDCALNYKFGESPIIIEAPLQFWS